MSDLDSFFDTEEPASKSQKDSSENSWNRRISWSQFKTYEECPKKWQLRYKEGHYVPSSSIHTIFGAAVHEAIQTYLNVLYHKSVGEAENLNLRSILVDKMKEEYKKAKKEFKESEYIEGDELPASQIEMKKFLMDGEKMIKSFLANRTEYFNTKTTDLVGIELQINHSLKENVDYVGYLDVVLKERGNEKYKVIDIKTSKEGWDKWKKKDKMRVNQVVSYKSYYSEVLGTDPSNIDVEYIILKRILKENKYYNQNRIQTFSPPSGSITQNKVREQINKFVEDCYNDDGSRKDKEYEPDPGRFSCPFCEFSSTFGGEYPVCGEGDRDWERDSWPKGMKPYMDDKWINEG